MRHRMALRLADWVMAHQAVSGVALAAACLVMGILAASTASPLVVAAALSFGAGLVALLLAAAHRWLDRLAKGQVNMPRLQGFHEWQVQGRVSAADCAEAERLLKEAIDGRRPGDRIVAFAGILLVAAAAFLLLGSLMLASAASGRGEVVVTLVACGAATGYLLALAVPLLREGLRRQRADSEALDAAEKALIAKAAAGSVKPTRLLSAPGADASRPRVTRVR